MITKKRRGPISYLILIIFGLFCHSCSILGEKVSKSNSNYYYSPDKKQILFCPMGNWFELGERPMDADVNSFRTLSDYYWARDTNYIYFENTRLDYLDIDLESFVIKDYMTVCDKDNVYVINFDDDGDKPITMVAGADPNTYENLEAPGFARDNKYLYYDNKICNIDPHSFSKINYSFARDDKNIFMLSKFTKNETHINFNTFTVDLNSVRMLDDYAIRDDNTFYQFCYKRNDTLINKLITIPINNDDIFHYEKEAYCRIGDKIYIDAFELKDADADSFEKLEIGYFRDKNYLYFWDKRIENVDFKTLRYNKEKYRYEDKNYIYQREKRTVLN